LHEWQQGWNLQGGWRGKLLPLPGMKTREQILNENAECRI
jgi:hypothetical protein